MSQIETLTKLASMQPSEFELIASTVLREADPKYNSLIHTGINNKGKTIPDPLDGIGFVKDAIPLHMICFHHTTCSKNEIRKK